MRDHLHGEIGLNAGADGYGGDPASDHFAPEAAVGLGDETEFVAVVGYIYVAGLELHQGTYAVQKFLLGDAAQRRNDFQGRERMPGGE